MCPKLPATPESSQVEVLAALERPGTKDVQVKQSTVRKVRFDSAGPEVVEYEPEAYEVVWTSMSEEDDGACLAGILLLLLGPGPHFTAEEQGQSAKTACTASVLGRAVERLEQAFRALGGSNAHDVHVYGGSNVSVSH